MNKGISIVLVVIGILAIFSLGVLVVTKAGNFKIGILGPTPSPTPIVTSSPTSSPALVSEVKIFLIALEDQGISGELIGCGDSAVSVTRQITPTTKPLTEAFNELLLIKTQYYGESGLYNALYQSTLKLDSAEVVGTTATIYLSGSLVLGGTCDNPRVEAQLKSTALQFSTVRTVNIFINNIPLEEVLSQKG